MTEIVKILPNQFITPFHKPDNGILTPLPNPEAVFLVSLGTSSFPARHEV